MIMELCGDQKLMSILHVRQLINLIKFIRYAALGVGLTAISETIIISECQKSVIHSSFSAYSMQFPLVIILDH